ncbi:monocarboxylate transporter 9, partial [Nephila pilipes]
AVVTKTRRIRIRMDGPDGGWAWVVAISACIINFIMAGLGRMSGILYVAFIETFGVDRKAASTPFSVRSSTRNLLGPVVGILGQKYGVRMVTITGGIMATVSAAVCFFAPDMVWITILWGVLN